MRVRLINIKKLALVTNKKSVAFFVFTLTILIISISYIVLKSVQQRSVSIQEQEAFVTQALISCYKKPNREACLKRVSQDIAKRVSLIQFSDIIRKNEKDEAIFKTCHEASHYLGRIAYEKEKDIGRLFTKCRHLCLDGCYHGVVEGYFIQKQISLQNYEVISSEVSKICKKEQDYETPELYVSCLHGLGHALMFVTDGELPQALTLCDVLQTTNEQELCYTGALMANADNAKSQDHPSKYIKADDPMYPCYILPQKHQKKCYEYNTLTFYNYTNYNWEETIKLCKQVPEDYRRGCFETMGGDQVGFTDGISKIKAECDLIDEPEFKMACFQGAESNLVMRYSEDFVKPIKFCTIMEEEYKSGCFESFFRLLNRWSRDIKKKKAICLKIAESEYQNRCLKAVE